MHRRHCSVGKIECCVVQQNLLFELLQPRARVETEYRSLNVRRTMSRRVASARAWNS